MIAALILLAAISSTPDGPQPLVVEVAEYNTVVAKDDPERIVLRQIILRRWMKLADGPNHYVAQWCMIGADPEPVRRGDRYEFTVKGVRISARSYRVTRSVADPERVDNRTLNQDDRVPYGTLLQ
jgi:hypothetical protein